ncbi:MAG: MarR family transcriptional regulator [Bilifractor sp.]|nr:MarR family transcriptional regulator [Bilifractor sp.]
MDAEHARMMMDTMYKAKRVWEQQPELPEGVTAGEIHILDCLVHLTMEKETVRVSDLSDALGLPRPGVTRMVKDLEEMGYIRKEPDSGDRRIVHLSLTEKGGTLYEKYVSRHFERITSVLKTVSDEDIEKISAIVGEIYEKLYE